MQLRSYLIILLVALCGVALSGASGFSTSVQCIIHKDCRACLLESQASCGWCEVEGRCSELNADGTIACSRGQTIFMGYCPDGSVPEQGFYERKDSRDGGFTHGYVGLALFLVVLVLWRCWRTYKGRRDKAAGKAHRRQDEAWRVMRQFRASVEMEKRKNKKLKDSGFLYDIHYAEPTPAARDEQIQPTEHVALGAGTSVGIEPSPAIAQPPQPPPPSAAAGKADASSYDDGSAAYSDEPGVPLDAIAARPPPPPAPPVDAAYMQYNASSSSSSVSSDTAPYGARRAPPATLRRPSSSSGSGSGSGSSSPPPSSSNSSDPPPL